MILCCVEPRLHAASDWSSWWSNFFSSENQQKMSKDAQEIGKDVQQKGSWTLSNYWHTFINTQNPTIQAHKGANAFLLKTIKNNNTAQDKQAIETASKVYSVGYLLTGAGVITTLAAFLNGDMKTLKAGAGLTVLGIGLGAVSTNMINTEMNKNKKDTKE